MEKGAKTLLFLFATTAFDKILVYIYAKIYAGLDANLS